MNHQSEEGEDSSLHPYNLNCESKYNSKTPYGLSIILGEGKIIMR